MTPSTPLPEADTLAQSAWTAYIRQELTAPAYALREYASNLAAAAETTTDVATKTSAAKILDRAGHLLHLVEKLTDPTLTANLDGLARKTLRHDLRGAAAYVIGACEDIGEVAAPDAADVLAEPLRSTLQAAKRVVELIEQVVNYEATPNSAPMVDDSLRQMLQQLQRGAAARKADAPTGRILLVDDNEYGRDLVARMLGNQGHTVEIVSSGVEALARLDELRSPPIDLILLDVLMPGMSGPEVLLKVKDNPATRDLPVLMVSALGEDETVLACISAGAVDYLTRPVKAELLRARITASLEQKRLRDRETQFQARIDELVRAIFPSAVIEEWQNTGTIKPRSHELVGILFLDVVGFTSYSEQYRDDPATVILLLQRLIEKFETSAARLGVQKIKTIGDAFMAAVGIAESVENPALTLLQCGLAFQKDTLDHPAGWSVRVGIHVGPVVTGILGKTQFSFDVWGHTVNAASRIESNGRPGRVTLSDEAWAMLAGCAAGECRHVTARGLGAVNVWDFTAWTK